MSYFLVEPQIIIKENIMHAIQAIYGTRYNAVLNKTQALQGKKSKSKMKFHTKKHQETTKLVSAD